MRGVLCWLFRKTIDGGGGKKQFSLFDSSSSFLKIFSILLLSVFFVAGCSGSGAGGDNASGSGSTGSAEKTVSGKVVYSGVSYNSSDKVCYDRDGNKACNEGEPFATVSENGSYTITGTEDDAEKVPLIAELYGEIISASESGKILAKAKVANDADEQRKSALIFETPAGKNTISSVTTIIKSKMDTEALPLDKAESQIKTALNTDEDLYASSGKIAGVAKKVTIVMNSLLDVLKSFNITISEEARILVMKDIAKQLPNIALKEDDKLKEIKEQTTISEANGKDFIQNEVNMSTIAVQTAQKALSGEGLEIYNFKLNLEADKIPYFALNKLNSTFYKEYADKSIKWGMPDTNKSDPIHSIEVRAGGAGSVTGYNSDNEPIFKMLTVETVDLNGKTLKASPVYPGKSITFLPGAVAYRMTGDNIDRIKSFEKDLVTVKQEGCNGKMDDYLCTEKVTAVFDSSNPINFEASYGHKIDIKMHSDKTYVVNYKYEGEYYWEEMPFSGRFPKLSGVYEWSEADNLWTFKNKTGKPVFKIFKIQPDGYILAGYLFDRSQDNDTYGFNKIAAEDIKQQWGE